MLVTHDRALGADCVRDGDDEGWAEKLDYLRRCK